MYTLKVGRKTADFYLPPVLSKSDKIPLCKLKGDFQNRLYPLLVDFFKF